MPSSKTARNNETILLRRVAAQHQNTVAERMGWSATKASRFFSPGDDDPSRASLAEFLQLLDQLDIVMVDSSSGSVTLSDDKYQALRTLAREALS